MRKPIPLMRVVDIKRFPSGQVVGVEKMVPARGRTVAQVDADEATTSLKSLMAWGHFQ